MIGHSSAHSTTACIGTLYQEHLAHKPQAAAYDNQHRVSSQRLLQTYQATATTTLTITAKTRERNHGNNNNSKHNICNDKCNGNTSALISNRHYPGGSHFSHQLDDFCVVTARITIVNLLTRVSSL